MIAKTLKAQNLTPARANKVFMQMCQDILASETSRVGSKTNQDRVKEIVRELVAKEVSSRKNTNVSMLTNKVTIPVETFGTETEENKNLEKESLVEV